VAIETKETPLLLGVKKTEYQSVIVTETAMKKSTHPSNWRFFKPLPKMHDDCYGALFSMLFLGTTLSYLAMSNCSCESTTNTTLTNQTLPKVDPHGRAIVGSLAGTLLFIPCLYFACLIKTNCHHKATTFTETPAIQV
jgi:hypothetical protein